MKYSIYFAAKARQDLNEIAVAVYNLSKDKTVTRNVISDVKNAVTQLADFPLSGKLPIDRNLLSLGYRYLIERDYLIFYSIDETKNRVLINAVVNGKTDYVSKIINEI